MELAQGCDITLVESWLDHGMTRDLVDFLRKRYRERFFDPINCLKKAAESTEGYGFSMMSLCCLLAETIQCYREGVPSTSKAEWPRLLEIQQNGVIPKQYQLPPDPPINGREAFRRFFADHQRFFPCVNGHEFYDDIRNGLLHQAQTKGEWTINIRGTKVCDPSIKNINRNLFATGLKDCFDACLVDLEARSWDHQDWANAARKLWWLIRLSKP